MLGLFSGAKMLLVLGSVPNNNQGELDLYIWGGGGGWNVLDFFFCVKITSFLDLIRMMFCNKMFLGLIRRNFMKVWRDLLFFGLETEFRCFCWKV